MGPFVGVALVMFSLYDNRTVIKTLTRYVKLVTKISYHTPKQRLLALSSSSDGREPQKLSKHICSICLNSDLIYFTSDTVSHMSQDSLDMLCSKG